MRPGSAVAEHAVRPLAGLLLLSWLACGDEPQAQVARGEPTSGAESAPGLASQEQVATKPPPPLPEPFDGTFSLPIRVPLSLIAERIDAGLPNHEIQDWRKLTEAGKSPSLEARFEVWRDPVKLEFASSTLLVEVPVHYAARFNARVKNPFGGSWISVARDEAWGTKQEPQRVTLRLRTRVELSKDWRLRLRTFIDKPEHGPPPEGKLCTSGSFKLCVSKASFASEVERRIDAELLERMRKAAEELDQRTEQLVDLRARVEQVWATLGEPIPLSEHGRWLQLQPLQAALDLRAEGDAVIVEPAIAARVSYHDKKPQTGSKPPPLPERSRRDQLSGRPAELPDGLAPSALLQLVETLAR